MKSLKPFSMKDQRSIEEYLNEDYNNNLKTVQEVLDRGFTFEDNMLSCLLRLSIVHGATATVSNPLRNRNGRRLQPTGFIVVMDGGHHRNCCRGATFNENEVSFKNYDGSTDETWDILLFFSPSQFVKES